MEPNRRGALKLMGAAFAGLALSPAESLGGGLFHRSRCRRPQMRITLNACHQDVGWDTFEVGGNFASGMSYPLAVTSYSPNSFDTTCVVSIQDSAGGSPGAYVTWTVAPGLTFTYNVDSAGNPVSTTIGFSATPTLKTGLTPPVASGGLKVTVTSRSKPCVSSRWHPPGSSITYSYS
jgi:hypothetical protein